MLDSHLEKGDALREQALRSALERHDVHEIPGKLEEVRKLHANDPVRLVRLQTVTGRVQYAEGSYDEAVRAFIMADFYVRLLAKPHPRLAVQNTLYWLKACLMQAEDLPMIARLIRDLRESKNHLTHGERFTVALLEAFGRPGCRLIDWLTYTDGNRFTTWIGRIGPTP
ncbi:MAG TPA: hypothetical protein VK497_05905 [Candidatus Saccharimonadales bacterium]|nr:hypothetical protein [Candidatus Saccharimonadales bacterium]